MHRPARERAAAHQLIVDAGAVPGQRVALIPAPFLRPQLELGARRHRLGHEALDRLPGRGARAERAAWRRWRPSRRWRLAPLAGLALVPRLGAIGRLGAVRALGPDRQHLGQELAGVGLRDLGHLFRRARRDHLAALVPALGPEVDQAVRHLDHVQVVLDHDDRVAGRHQPLEHLQQPLDVGEVQAGGRLVQDVHRPPGRHLAQLGGELDPLGLAARQRRRRLPEPHVAQADVDERVDPAADLRDVGEELLAPRRSASPARRRSSCP